jgi:hypothetical protein
VPATTGSMEVGNEFSASSKTNTMTSGQRWQANFSVTVNSIPAMLNF